MSWRRLFAVFRKEIRHISREARTLLLVTVSPALLLILLAYIFSFEIEQISLGLLDFDRTSLSRQYVSAITNDGDFTIKRTLNDYQQIRDVLRRGEVDAVVVIPAGFAEKVLRGEEASLQMVVDGMDPISASQAVSYLEARSEAFVATHHPYSRIRVSRFPPQVHTQIWFNPGLKSINSMVPGLMAIVLTLPAMAMALGLTREKETGTFEALIATPIRGLEYLLGKLLAYMASGIISSLLTLAIAVLWFDIPFYGDLTVFLLLAADFFLACMGISLLVGHFVSSQQAAMFIVLLFFIVPSFFLGGLILPVKTDNLSSMLSSYIFPTTHFITICRRVILKGLGVLSLREPALILAGMGGVTTAISISLFQKKLA